MTEELALTIPTVWGRIKAAAQALSGQMHFNPYGQGGGVNFGGTFYTAGGPTYGGPGIFGDRMAGTDINYLREIGDLTQSSLVMAAVNWMGRTFGDAPLVVQKEDAKGTNDIVNNHEVANLWKYPNPFYSCSQMAKAMSLSWILNGNIYILKNYDKRGRVVELWWLPHWMVRPRWEPQTDTSYITHYDYSVGRNVYSLPIGRVIHLRNGIDPHYDRCGMSPLLSLLRELFSDIEIMNYAALLARAGGVPPWFATPKEGVNSVNINPEQLKEKIVRMTGGDRRGQVAFIPIGMEVHSLGFEPAKMDLTALHRVPEERLAAVIGIPASTLGFGGIKDDPTYANAKQADARAYATFCVPMWTAMAMDLTKQLLHADFDDDPLLSIIFDTKKVPALQEDEDKAHTRYREDAKAGLITVHQFQECAGYEHPDEEAKYYLIPSSSAPTTSEMAMQAASAPPVQLQPQIPDGEIIDALPADDPKQLTDGTTPQQKRLAAMKDLTDDDLKIARAFWQSSSLGDMSKLWDAQSNGNGAH